LVALAVDLPVQQQRALLHVIDSEAWIGLRRLVMGALHLGFDEDARSSFRRRSGLRRSRARSGQ
jgi:hypothetical protein